MSLLFEPEHNGHDLFKTALIRRPLLEKTGLDDDILKNYCPISNLALVIEKGYIREAQ